MKRSVPADLPPAPHDLYSLFARGDWACAHTLSAGLAETAHLLGLCIPPPQVFDLLEVERLAAVDMAKASRLWKAVTPELRDRLFGPDSAERR
jgi:hypothetical protein